MEKVLDLWRRAAAEPSVTDDPDALRRKLDRDRSLFVLAWDRSRLVGSLIGGWDGWRGHMYRLAVDRACRRRGIARRLVKNVEAHLRRLGAVRIDDFKYRFIDQPNGWLGAKTQVDIPYLINLRLDPFERQGWPNNGTKDGAQQYFDWFKFQFWRFVFVQQVMGKELQTFLDYPPMQRGASFNLDAVKAEMAKKMEQAQAAAKGTAQ